MTIPRLELGSISYLAVEKKYTRPGELPPYSDETWPTVSAVTGVPVGSFMYLLVYNNKSIRRVLYVLEQRRLRLSNSITDFPETKPTEEELAYLYLYTGEMIELYQTLLEIRMSNQYAILLREVDQTIPLAVLKIVTEMFPSGVGVATAKDNKVIIEKLVGAADADALFEAMNSSDAKGCKQLYVFLKSINTPLESDIPPYPCLSNGDTILGCVAVEGQMEQYDKPGTSYSPAYWLTQNMISPKMQKLFKASDSDIDAFYLDMQGDGDAGNVIQQFIPNDGSMVFLFANNEQQAFVDDVERAQEFPWGFSYGNPPSEDKPEDNPLPDPQPAAAPAAKPLSGLRRAGGPSVPVASTVPVTPQPKPADTKTPEPDPKTKDGMVLPVAQSGTGYMIPGKDEIWECPPANVATKDDLRAWYVPRIGHFPNNWKKRPWAPRISQGKAVKLGDLHTSTVIPPNAGKDTSARNLPPSVILAEAQIKNLQTNILPKILGANSEVIHNPSKILETEGNNTSIAAQFKVPSIKDFSYAHAARCQLMEAASPENGIIPFVSNIWGNLIIANETKEKKIAELEARLAKLATEEIKPAAKPQAAPPFSEATPTEVKPKVISGLRVRAKA